MTDHDAGYRQMTDSLHYRLDYAGHSTRWHPGLRSHRLGRTIAHSRCWIEHQTIDPLFIYTFTCRHDDDITHTIDNDAGLILDSSLTGYRLMMTHTDDSYRLMNDWQERSAALAGRCWRTIHHDDWADAAKSKARLIDLLIDGSAATTIDSSILMMTHPEQVTRDSTDFESRTDDDDRLIEQNEDDITSTGYVQRWLITMLIDYDLIWLGLIENDWRLGSWLITIIQTGLQTTHSLMTTHYHYWSTMRRGLDVVDEHHWWLTHELITGLPHTILFAHYMRRSLTTRHWLITERIAHRSTLLLYIYARLTCARLMASSTWDWDGRLDQRWWWDAMRAPRSIYNNTTFHHDDDGYLIVGAAGRSTHAGMRSRSGSCCRGSSTVHSLLNLMSVAGIAVTTLHSSPTQHLI